MVTQSVSPKHVAKHVICLFHRKPNRFRIWSERRAQYNTRHDFASRQIFTFYLWIVHHKCLLSIPPLPHSLLLLVSFWQSLSLSLSVFFLSLCDHWLASPWFWLTSLSLKSDSRHISGGITQNTWVKKLTEKDQVSSLIKIYSMRLVRKWVIVLVSEWFAIMANFIHFSIFCSMIFRDGHLNGS